MVIYISAVVPRSEEALQFKTIHTHPYAWKAVNDNQRGPIDSLKSYHLSQSVMTIYLSIDLPQERNHHRRRRFPRRSR